MPGRFGLWSILWIVMALGSSTIAQVCSFWDGGCVDPMAQTAISFDFPPLFIEDITLYYGFDANSRGKGHEPMTKVSYWLGYEAHSINNSVIDSNRTLEVGVRVGNLTGTPSGGNNGCDGVWGSQCSRTLKELLKDSMYKLYVNGDYYKNPLDTVLQQMKHNHPYLSSCPPQFFDVQHLPVSAFAQETDTDKSAELQTSGTSDDPWKTWFIDGMTARQQAQQVAVAILSRGPSYNSQPVESKDDIWVELACTQAPSSGSTSNQDPS